MTILVEDLVVSSLNCRVASNKLKSRRKAPLLRCCMLLTMAEGLLASVLSLRLRSLLRLLILFVSLEMLLGERSAGASKSEESIMISRERVSCSLHCCIWA